MGLKEKIDIKKNRSEKKWYKVILFSWFIYNFIEFNFSYTYRMDL